MKKFLLGSLLSGDKLDVVDQQAVDVPELLPEFRHLVVADGIDQFIHEDLRRDIDHVQVRKKFQGLQADGVEQVGLSQSHAAVDEQRVVIFRRLLGDGRGGGMGELVA